MSEWHPRCFGHYKDADTDCNECEIYYECYKQLMTNLMNNPEAPRIVIK